MNGSRASLAAGVTLLFGYSLAACGASGHSDPPPSSPPVRAEPVETTSVGHQVPATTDSRLVFLGTVVGAAGSAASAIVRVDGAPATHVVTGDRVGKATIENIGVDFVKVRRQGQVESYQVGGQKAEPPAAALSPPAVSQVSVDEAFERSLNASRLFLPQQ